MLKSILPFGLYSVVVDRLNMDKLYEIRLRLGGPVVINYGGKYYYVNSLGISDSNRDCLVCSASDLQGIMMRATDNSIYAATKQINAGFLTIKGGVRIGVCGEVVWDNTQIRAVKNFYALNIRVPHQVCGCATKSFGHIMPPNCTRPKNTLIISPPGAGKTTHLRDIARLFGNTRPILNVLLVDERSELAAVFEGKAQLDVGLHTDIISNSSKAYAFEQGIRAMRPDIIITDEIASASDILAIQYALSAGVCVIASVHAQSYLDLPNKLGFEHIVDKKLFDIFVVLSSERGPGTVDEIITN